MLSFHLRQALSTLATFVVSRVVTAALTLGRGEN
jgi:hypothetical protein